MIGKRKREVTVVSREEADSDSDSEPPVSSAAAHDVFRNFFESRFEPLEPVQRPAREEDSSVERHIEQDKLEDTSEDASEEDSEKEWSGISEDGGEEDSGQQAVEVVEFTDVRNPNEDILDKRVLKSFMVRGDLIILPSESESPLSNKHTVLQTSIVRRNVGHSKLQVETRRQRHGRRHGRGELEERSRATASSQRVASSGRRIELEPHGQEPTQGHRSTDTVPRRHQIHLRTEENAQVAQGGNTG